MRIVITGASGLIGRSLLSRLPDHEVWALSRRSPVPLPSNVTWVPCDLAGDLPSGLPQRADAVVHLAQSQRFREFPDQALEIFDVNVGSTARLLDWARRAGAGHFVVASSGGLHTASPEHPYYLTSKQAAELLASTYRAIFNVLVLRFFFVYGGGQNPTMLVPRMIDAVQSGGAIRLPGGTGPRLNPIHVSDAATAIAVALERRLAGTLDIAGPQVLTLKEICEEIGARLGRVPCFSSLPEEPVANLVGDISLMSDRLGAPALRFADGVGEVLHMTGAGR